MFAKGHQKLGGKQKGTTHLKTKQWDYIADYITESGAERFIDILKNSSNRDFMKYYLSVIEYFKPKMQRTETKINDSDNEIKITFDIDSQELDNQSQS